MASFYRWGSSASRLQSHFKEAVYFLQLSSQKFLVLILSTSEGWKAESTLEPPSGFEHGILDWESSILTTRSLLKWSNNKIRFSFNQPNKKRRVARLVDVIKHTPKGIFLVIPSLEAWSTKAEEAPSTDEVRLTLLETNPVFQFLGKKLNNYSMA